LCAIWILSCIQFQIFSPCFFHSFCHHSNVLYCKIMYQVFSGPVLLRPLDWSNIWDPIFSLLFRTILGMSVCFYILKIFLKKINFFCVKLIFFNVWCVNIKNNF
jgi:hypothetical protein